MRKIKDVLVATFKGWSEDKAPKLAAALAYYSCFALPPLLVIAIWIAGAVFGKDAAMHEVVAQMEGLVGRTSAETIQAVLVTVGELRAGVVGTIVGILALVFGASGVFGELQDSLNVIWKVKKKPGRGILGTLKDRFFSLTMVFGLGFLLLISLVLSAGLSALSTWVAGADAGIVLQVLSFVVSLTIVGSVFTLLFRFVPDARTPWKYSLTGGMATAILFSAGKFALGAYLGHSKIATSYGAAGAFLLVLLWVYYSSQILFLGAELTTTLAARSGAAPQPDPDAVRSEQPARTRTHRAPAESPRRRQRALEFLITWGRNRRRNR
jgi:membrane protein